VRLIARTAIFHIISISLQPAEITGKVPINAGDNSLLTRLHAVVNSVSCSTGSQMSSNVPVVLLLQVGQKAELNYNLDL